MNGLNEIVTFFTQKVFIISFGHIGLIFLLCFFCLFTGKYKLGLLLSYFSIGVLFAIEVIGWNCLEVIEQDLCFIYLVQPPS